MGMYTLWGIKAQVSSEIHHYVNSEISSKRLTAGPYSSFNNHSFFGTPRCDQILHELYIEDDFLVGRGNIKNYDEEVEFFFDWISGHVTHGGVIGWHIYEVEYMPTLVEVPKFPDLSSSESPTNKD